MITHKTLSTLKVSFMLLMIANLLTNPDHIKNSKRDHNSNSSSRSKETPKKSQEFNKKAIIETERVDTKQDSKTKIRIVASFE